MDRIQILAVAIAVGLIAISLLYRGAESPPAAPAPGPPASSAPPPGTPPLIPPVPGAEAPALAVAPEVVVPLEVAGRDRRSFELANDVLRVRVSNIGGRLESIELPDYAGQLGTDAGPVELVTDPLRGTLVASLGAGPFLGMEQLPHEVVSSDAHHVVLRLERNGIEVTRRIEIDAEGYGGTLRVGVKNRGGVELQPAFSITWFGAERLDAPDRFQSYSLIAMGGEDLDRVAVAGIGRPGFLSSIFGGGTAPTGERFAAPTDWVGVDSQYFLAAAVAENPRDAEAYLGPLGGDVGRAVLSYPSFRVPPGTGVERTYLLYLGPKLRESVAAVSPSLDPALDVGWRWVRPLVDFFAQTLVWIHDNIFGNYGVAIIILTIILRLLTYPLTQRSMKSMKRFSAIAPEMKALQEKHTDDKAKLQEELMTLYRRKGMNPLTAVGGGCIPMLIQMPFMIALYFALRASIELRHAPFMLWINDLSAPENFLDVFGIPIRVLPLLMGGSMLLQQQMTPTPSADPQQKQMMTMMSLMFIFLFYQFPSGLVLYWFVSNLLGIAQQLLVNRKPAPETG